MAYYAALVSIVQLLKDITHHDHPYSDYVLDKQELHLSLYKKFNLLQELLDGYSRKYQKEESADLLESRIKDAACDAQDIIESHVSDLFCEQIEEDMEKVETKVGFSGEKLMKIKESNTTNEDGLQKKYYEDLEKVNAEVDSIVEEMVRIKMEGLTTQEDGLQLDSHITTDSVEGTSNVEAPSGRNTMVGIEEPLRAIKEQLCGESVKLEVISIVGMGGLGKTTLARYIFNDKLIDDHFDCRAWVTVSQDYHMPKVLQAIANSLNITKEEELAEDIRKHLFGRRYLIVIDDIWDTKVWDDIKRIFPDTSKQRSRIMLTTRWSDVAHYAGNSIFLHQMHFLNEDQSWTLLKQKVFPQEHCPEELEVIGKSIAKNCRGLPLGIVVIAGVLSNVNKAQHDWEEIARAVRSVAIHQNDEHLLSILSLSYNHLPHHLKPCFLYLGGFPEDHEIRISELIMLWVAEGFLKPIESKSLEEVGKEYFKGLVNRNLVLITKKKFNGEFKSCSIHDLLKDLCSQKAHSEDFLFSLHQNDDLYRNRTGNVRRAYIGVGNDPVSGKFHQYFPHVRSVIFLAKNDHVSSIVSSCKLLRILDTVRMSHLGENFVTGIVKLLHLRYLKGGYSADISPLIFIFQNLQTFIIEDGWISLPIEIWKMPRLKHLIAKGGLFLPPIPYGEIRIIDGVPLLGSLQSLYRVKNFKFTSHTIEMIPNLKKLKVDYFTDNNDDDYEYWEEFEVNNLVHLHKLEILEINFFGGKPVYIAFPSNLIKLSLSSLRLHWKDMSIVGSLPHLQVLKLRMDSFMGEEWEPIEGEFLKLKILQMQSLYDLKYWRAENIHFPCLEQLYIWYCYELEEIPLEIGDISTLQLIEVKCYRDNSALKSSALKIQEEQRDQGNDDLQVCVFEIQDFR